MTNADTSTDECLCGIVCIMTSADNVSVIEIRWAEVKLLMNPVRSFLIFLSVYSLDSHPGRIESQNVYNSRYDIWLIQYKVAQERRFSDLEFLARNIAGGIKVAPRSQKLTKNTSIKKSTQRPWKHLSLFKPQKIMLKKFQISTVFKCTNAKIIKNLQP